MRNTAVLKTPSYTRHKVTGQAVVCANERDLYQGKYRSKSSLDAYRRLVAELIANDGIPPSANDVSIIELLVAYIRFAKVLPMTAKA